MDCKNRIIKLRESTGLNRKDFCKLVHPRPLQKKSLLERDEQNP